MPRRRAGHAARRDRARSRRPRWRCRAPRAFASRGWRSRRGLRPGPFRTSAGREVIGLACRRSGADNCSVTRGHPALLLLAASLVLPIPASAEAKLRFRPCDDSRCAVLSVPLDHSGTVPGRLSLRVERRDGFAQAEHGVTLVLPERPGERFLPTDDFAWETDGRDLLRFEQRGTGAGALRCRDLEAAAATDAGREAAACATLLGDRRAFFRTSDTVDDIEALRVELGVERLAIVGPGYGGYVAQRYAMRYPDHVEKLLLLSPVDAAGLDPLYGDSMAAVRRILPRSVAAAVAASRATCSGTPRASSRSWLASRSGGRSSGPPGTGARRPSPARSCCSRSWRAMTTSCCGPSTRPRWRPRCTAIPHRSCARSGVRSRTGGLSLPASRAPPPTRRRSARRSGSRGHGTPHPPSATPRRFSTETAMDPSLAAPFDPGTLVRSDLMRLCRRWPTASPSPPPDPGPMPDVPVLVLAGPERVGFSLETARRTAARFRDGKVLETP